MKSNKTEILGFEDSWKENRHVCESTKNLAKVMYLDGQKSKQSEIEDLQKNFNNALKTIDIQQQFLDDTDGAIKIITSQVGELQNRIDEISNHVEINYDENRDDDSHSYWSGYNQALRELSEIIKGNTNEH